MSIAILNFTGSTVLNLIAFSTAPGSKYVLTGLTGWKENPPTQWDTYPRWNGRGSFVSKRFSVPSRVIELEASVLATSAEFQAIAMDLGRMNQTTDISLTVTEAGVSEVASQGVVANARTWNQIGDHAFLSLSITFMDPYIKNTVTSAERL